MRPWVPRFGRLHFCEYYFTVPSTNTGSTMQVQVLASGAVRIGGAMRGDYISLDGITYRTT